MQILVEILWQLSSLLAHDGTVHIIDMVLPESPFLPRLMARLDRGSFPRELAHWRQLFSGVFDEIAFVPGSAKLCGLSVYHGVYFKGKGRLEGRFVHEGSRVIRPG